MNKKNLILGVVLIVLIGLAYLYQGPIKKWQENKGKPVNFLAKLAVDKIDRITIDNQGQQVLQKKENQWYLEGKPAQLASSTKISNLINQLNLAIKAGIELVSTNNLRKSEFQTDISGSKVVLSGNGIELASFTVGKPNSDFSSAYLSPTSSDSTYLLKDVNLYVVFIDKSWTDPVKKK